MDFLTDRIKPIYFKYLSASFGTAMIASIYSIVDVAMVGQYQGPEGTAALAVVAPVWNIIYSLGLLMGAVALAVPAWVGIIFFDRPILTFFGADSSLLVLAQAYMRPIKYVFPLYLFNQVVAAFLRNDKSPGLATLGVLCGGIFNIFGDYFFVFTCFLFRPRKSREKRRKRSHTNVSSTLSTRSSTPPAQTATFAFTSESGYTTRLSEKNRTQRLARRNRGHFGWGAIITLDTNCTFTNIPGPGIRTANFAPLGSGSRVLPKNAKSLRDSDALMCVAVPRRRGPAGLRDPFAFVEIAACTPCARSFLCT